MYVAKGHWTVLWVSRSFFLLPTVVCRYLVCDTVSDEDDGPGGGRGGGGGDGRHSVASRDSSTSGSTSATFVMDGQRWDFFLAVTANIAGGFDAKLFCSM
jgi:hypothetical protein